jgi:hypothetical protein
VTANPVRKVAALFVQTGGVYWDRWDVEAWDEQSDARTYSGSSPVVAHPPCSRWCWMAKLVESLGGGAVGDDHGCFASALASIRRCGGVLEHPAWSMAWGAHGLPAPPSRGWHRDIDGGWCCEVSQAAYGHRARKLTWLYYVGRNPPATMDWSRPEARGVVSGMRNNCGRPLTERVWQREASATPPLFAESLIDLARNCGGAP